MESPFLRENAGSGKRLHPREPTSGEIEMPEVSGLSFRWRVHIQVKLEFVFRCEENGLVSVHTGNLTCVPPSFIRTFMQDVAGPEAPLPTHRSQPIPTA